MFLYNYLINHDVKTILDENSCEKFVEYFFVHGSRVRYRIEWSWLEIVCRYFDKW